ncbi:COG1361 family protein [Plantactinospora endophytica]|uniref:Peptidase n=1 Tax=Plantactinospora endophytica TaxID=673535 RepID=A0ABQ4DSA2_9ACTN|nr:hypothetical protein [Plantactinospora endophytica]GIG85333.1 hypothetical protein Pen02_02690 [Plantactinospora endophytica]
MSRTRTRWAPAAAAALLAGLSVNAVTPPAAAAEASPALSVSYAIEARIDNTETTVPTYLYNYGDAPATDVTVAFDASGLRDVTIKAWEYAEECKLAGAVVTCEYPDLAPGQTEMVYPFTLASKPRSEPGPAGTVKATIRGVAPDGSTHSGGGDLDVTIVPTGPDLVAQAENLNTADSRVGPGDEVGFRGALYNDGDTPAEGFFVRIQLPTGGRWIDQYEDCTYIDYWPGEHPDGYAYGPSEVVCTAPLTLAPDEGFLLFDPESGESIFNAYFGKNLAGPTETDGFFEVGLLDDLGENAARVATRKGTGKSFADAVKSLGSAKKGAKGVAREVDTNDNAVFYKIWTKANTNDFAVTAEPVSGAVGDTVTVPYTLVNNGPSDGAAGWRIVAPTGTVLVRGGDEWCYFLDENGHRTDELPEVGCGIESEWPSKASGQGTVQGAIKVRIISEPGDNGTIKVTSFGPSKDNVPGNDVVPLSIDTSGGGGGGGGLPVTGVKAGIAGGVGVAAIALGVLLYVFTRRRRIVTVVPKN